MRRTSHPSFVFLLIHLFVSDIYKKKMYPDHSKNMYIKERKIAWSVSSKSSKALRFPSFHKVQNKHNGTAFHTFFLFFPIKTPHQLVRASLIEEGITHCT